VFTYPTAAFFALLSILTWSTLVMYYRLNRVEVKEKWSDLVISSFTVDLKNASTEKDVEPDNSAHRMLPFFPKFNTTLDKLFAPDVVSRPLSIIFTTRFVAESSVLLPEKVVLDVDAVESPDYNGLQISFFIDEVSQRNIYQDPDSGDNYLFGKLINHVVGNSMDNDMDV
jgi:hypothetical protein